MLQLTRYDERMRDTAQAQYLHGSYPLDMTLPATRRFALLLAAFGGRAGLYHVDIAGPPTLTPIWQSQLPPMRRILGVEDFDGDGSEEALLLGDSAVVMVGLDGRERFAIRGDMIDGFVHRADSTRIILVSRDAGSVLVTWLSERGALLGQSAIDGSSDILTLAADMGVGNELLVATLSSPARLYRLDLRRMLIVGERQLPGAPDALVPYLEGGVPTAAALYRALPAPTILPVASAELPRRFDYPLADAFDEAALSPHLIALATRDSIAVFNREMRLLAVVASPGGRDLSVTELDSTRTLLVTTAGSRIVPIDREGPGWLERNWMTALIYASAAALVIVMLLAARRYRFVRTLYNNLVRVPGSHGVIVISPSQRVVHINRSAREVLEIASYIPLGRHVSEYLVSEQTRLVMSLLRRLFADGEAFEVRADITMGLDTRALTFRGRQMFGQYGFAAGYLLLVEDVTQTIERERLVNWASVAHHIAHEMKTPLGTVKVTAEMLHDRLASNGFDPENHRATTRILKQSQRLREIVDDLLTIARTETLHRVSADLSLLVTSTAHECRESYPPSLDLMVQITGDDFRCSIDVNQLTIAIRNLLDNAWQAIGDREGGRIEVTVIDRGDAGVDVTVSDNGVGMSRDTMAKLFQPFYTEREGGSGIGTVIVKRVVEAHGGIVTVESEQGKGTSFLLNLPR